jgi:hypothetical protein
MASTVIVLKLHDDAKVFNGTSPEATVSHVGGGYRHWPWSALNGNRNDPAIHCRRSAPGCASSRPGDSTRVPRHLTRIDVEPRLGRSLNRRSE